MRKLRRQCLVREGFGRLDDAHLADLDLPLRFSPALFLGLTAIGIATRNPVLFGLLATLAA